MGRKDVSKNTGSRKSSKPGVHEILLRVRGHQDNGPPKSRPVSGGHL